MLAARGPGLFCTGAIGSVVFWQNLGFKGVQRACTVIQFGRGKNKIRVLCECRAESVDNARVSTGSAQCKVYPGSFSVPEAK